MFLVYVIFYYLDCKINREAMIDFKSYTSFEILEFKRKQIL